MNSHLAKKPVCWLGDHAVSFCHRIKTERGRMAAMWKACSQSESPWPYCKPDCTLANTVTTANISGIDTENEIRACQTSSKLWGHFLLKWFRQLRNANSVALIKSWKRRWAQWAKHQKCMTFPMAIYETPYQQELLFVFPVQMMPEIFLPLFIFIWSDPPLEHVGKFSQNKMYIM